MQGCYVYTTTSNPTLETEVKNNQVLNVTVTSVDVANNNLTINGTGLSAATGVQMTGTSLSQTFSITSISDSQIVAQATSAVAFAVSESLNLIISNASAQTTFPITFTLQDGAVLAGKIAQMGATSGQVLKWNGTTSAWAPATLASSQVYRGSWDATSNSPSLSDATAPPSGEYYIVTTAGSQDLTIGTVGPIVNYVVGDWVMSNGAVWDKITGSLNGAGTTNYFPYYASSSTLANSPMYLSGTSIGINNTSPGSALDVKGTLRLSGSTSGYVGFSPAAVAGTTTYTLPSTQGTAGQVLSTDGTATTPTLSWATAATIGTSLGGDIEGTIAANTIGTSKVTSTHVLNGTILNEDINASAAIDAAKINTGVVSNAEYNYLNGVTSGIQAQFTSKEDTLTAGSATQYYRGDKTWVTLDTSIVPENTNLYFNNTRAIGATITAPTLTNAIIAVSDSIQIALGKLQAQINNVLSTLLTGFSNATTTAITSADSILSAFGKAQGQINTLTTNSLVKNSTDSITGVVNVGTIGLLNITYTPVNATDAVNKSYVDTSVTAISSAVTVAATTYTLSASDNKKVIIFTSASAVTVTVPSGLGTGFTVDCYQNGAGQVIFVGSGGVTVQNAFGLTKTRTQYSGVSVYIPNATDANLVGDVN